MNLPTGTVTFLFTDIEGSTKLWEQHPIAMRMALARHDVLMHQSIAAQDGVVFKTMGDAFCAAFATASQALMAAFTAQQALQNEPWLEPLAIHVRMALHTGTTDERDGDYFGPPLNRVARLMSAGHGGQTLLSFATQELTRDVLPDQCSLQDLGQRRLKDLGRPEHVFQLLHPDLRSEFPPLKSLDNPDLPNNLPQQVSSFIGREKELTTVKDWLEKTRLLTLTGSGGCGKTRLSLQAAADVLDRYFDGVWLVELASLSDPSLVPQAVAGVLGIKEQVGKTYTQVLVDSLKAKTLLLVLDNCEHMLDACAGLADTLLRNCPHVKILASSREALNIAGEQTYRVPSLSSPDLKQSATPESLSQYEAVQLFVDRAMAALPSFAVTNANAPALASICHRVDGIPLAIELAAARVRSLSVEEINARLDNRFRLLTGGSRTALPRQQTLRSLIDWSYDLLTEPEKSLLCRLSVFAGGWTLAAAEVVCLGDDLEDWEVLDLLASLVDKSLVQCDEAEGQTRYRFLETVRQYAHDRLAEGDACALVQEQHRDYFLALIQEIKFKLLGAEQAHWLSVLETEHDNLRQAITFCLEDPDGAEKGLGLGEIMYLFWATRGHLSEGRERMTALLSRPEAQTRTKLHADVLNYLGGLVWLQSDYGSAQSLYEESLAIYREIGNKQGIVNSLLGLGNVASDLGDNGSARSLYEESLATYRELGNKYGIAASLANLGLMAVRQGDYIAARSQFEECMANYQELGNKPGIGDTRANLGNLALQQGDYGSAGSLYEESLAIYREIGNKRGHANSLSGLGEVATQQGNYGSARSLYEESLAIYREIGQKMSIANALLGLGTVALYLRDNGSARSLYEESLATYRELGDKRGIANSLGNLGSVALYLRDFGWAQSLYEESLASNRELGNKKGIANSLLNLGELAQLQGDYAAARSLQQESLAISQELKNKQSIATSLEAFATLSVKEGNAERAARLWGASEALREEIGTPLPPNEHEEYDRQVVVAREALGEDAFIQAWAAGRAMSMEQAVAYAMEDKYLPQSI